MSELTLRMFDALHSAGALTAAVRTVTPALEEAARQLVALLTDWDDDRADALFTDNVAMDDSYAHRRAMAAEIIGDSGPLVMRDIVAVSDAGADVHLADIDGARITIELELSPLLPPRIESFSVQR